MYIEVVSLCINIELSTFCALKWFNMCTEMGSLVYNWFIMYVKLFIMYIEVGPWCAPKWFIMFCTVHSTLNLCLLRLWKWEWEIPGMVSKYSRYFAKLRLVL
jgi:hypothetical protein